MDAGTLFAPAQPPHRFWHDRRKNKKVKGGVGQGQFFSWGVGGSEFFFGRVRGTIIVRIGRVLDDHACGLDPDELWKDGILITF